MILPTSEPRLSVKIRGYVCGFLILLAAAIPALAQEPGQVIFGPVDKDYLKWDTFGNGDDEFHARFPKLPSVFLTRRDLKDVSGYA